MNSGRPLGLLALLPLYVAAATAAGFVDYHLRTSIEHAFTDYVPSVLSGVAEAPGRYRILGPLVYSSLDQISGLSPADAWVVFRWLCILLALLAGHVYFRTWLSPGLAVAGNFIVMGLLPLTMTNSWPHPDHLMELWLFTLACTAVVRGWNWTFLLLLAVNAFNRETSALLVLVFLVAAPVDARRLRWTLAAAVVWIAIAVALRWRLGWVPYSPWHLRENLTLLTWWPAGRDLYYRLYSWFFLFLLAPLGWMIAATWSRQPRFVRACSLTAAPAFLVVGLLFSSVIEPRIFTPLLVLLAPGVVIAIASEPAATEPGRDAPRAP